MLGHAALTTARAGIGIGLAIDDAHTLRTSGGDLAPAPVNPPPSRLNCSAGLPKMVEVPYEHQESAGWTASAP